MPVQAFQKVFRKPAYVVLALVVSASAFVFAVLLPNFRLVAGIVSSPDVPFSSEFEITISLLGSITTNFTVLSASYTIAIAFLAGINVALFVYYVKRQKQLAQGGLTVGSVGIVSGIFGMGCAACGSLILASLFGTAGGLSVIAFLPLRGGEFGILGVILLGISTYLLAKQIEKPMIC